MTPSAPALSSARPGPAPDRCTARQRRVFRVKFVVHPGLVDDEAPARVPSLLGRILGFLSAARR